MNRLLATITLSILLALPLLSPTPIQAAVDTNWVDGSNDGGSWYATEMYRARTTESVSVRPYAVTIFDTPMFRTIELILGAVPGVTVTADIMQKDPKYVQELNQKSAVAGIGNYIAMIYANPPADLALWIQDTGQTLGFLPKQAYAQGVGFSGLAPLLPIWKAFRNIAYLLLAIVMIVVGFMVMLRKKIDPKTVVTVQNALPRIVVTLLLITFSYAIVGIMIDLMYVLILFAVSVFKNSQLLPDPSGITATKLAGLTTPELLYTQGGLLPNVTTLDFSPWKLLFGKPWDPATANAISAAGGLVAAIILSSPFLLSAGFIGGAVGLGLGLAMPLLSLIIAVLALFLIIRLFVFFLSAYIKIIISLITGPLHILFEAVPGTNAFSSWFRNLTANIFVFPVGAVMFMLSGVFIKFSNEAGGNIWHPPYVGFASNAVSISSWIAMGIMFAIPSVVGQIQELLKAKPILPAGPEGIVGSLNQPVSLFMQIYQLWHSHASTEYMKEIAGQKRGR